MLNIVLVGNPNVGKSVIFNYLTGSYVDISNYPGTTIECNSGFLRDSSLKQKVKITDSPGVYSVSSFNDEETTTRDFVLNADLVINVICATTLKRDLFLTKQLCDLGIPMLCVLNQIDEAKSHNIEIDTDLLSRELNLNILECSAILNIGLSGINQAINTYDLPNTKFKTPDGDLTILKYAEPYFDSVLSRAEALLIAEGDAFIAQRNNIELPKNHIEQQTNIFSLRHDAVENIATKLIREVKTTWMDRLGIMCFHPLVGSVVAVIIIYTFLFLFLGVFIAGNVVDFIEINIFNQYYEPIVRYLVGLFAEIDTSNNLNPILFTEPIKALGTFLAGDYGVLTLTITYLYALLFPLVLGFYFGLAILEDSGYLPRLAVLVDGVLSKLGMNGRAIIPLILGGGCVTMATVTTRLLQSNKEKIITMALLGLTIPCSAQLGVIQGLLANLPGILPWIIWGGTLLIVFILTGLIMNKVLKGDSGHFITDIPPLRAPRIDNIFKKTASRTKIFMDEAIPAFFTASALVASLQVTGALKSIINFFEPILVKVLLLPKEVTLSFILGMVRRDFGAFGLTNLDLSPSQLVVTCIVLTLFVPCIATVAVMIKEKNLRTAAAIWLSSWILAFGLGAILARIIPIFLT